MISRGLKRTQRSYGLELRVGRSGRSTEDQGLSCPPGSLAISFDKLPKLAAIALESKSIHAALWQKTQLPMTIAAPTDR
jgi:hypothetical protein